MRRSFSEAIILTLCFAPTACVTYQGTAVDITPGDVSSDRGWIRLPDVEVVLQKDRRDCGAAAMTSVLRYWGGAADRERIAERYLGEDGDQRILAGDLRDYAKEQGLHAFLIKGKITDLEDQLRRGRPVIVGVIKPYSLDTGFSHYEVVVGYNPLEKKILTIDPAHGLRQNSEQGFLAEWEAAEHLMLVTFPPEKDQKRIDQPEEDDGPAAKDEDEEETPSSRRRSTTPVTAPIAPSAKPTLAAIARP
jgi:predicted double-glycine peptidase